MLRLTALVALASLTALSSGCDRQFVQGCDPAVGPDDPVELVAPPFQQIRRGHVRLRFESREIVDIPVSVEIPEQSCRSVYPPEVDRQPRTWSFPAEGIEASHPDQAGDFVLHNVELQPEDMPPARVGFTVHAGSTDDAVYNGTTRVVPVAGEGATVLFTGSLAPPAQADVLALVPDADLVLLGGDLRRDAVPESTWSQLAHDVAAAQPGALVHTAIGDLEDTYELSRDEVYMRWFAGQGRAGGNDRYYAIDVAGVRFVVLDGQDDRLGIEGSVQWRWLVDELQDVATDEALTEAIVVMHRGPHGLTAQVPNAGLRDELLPMLRQAGVRVLLSGHGQAYQRFEDQGLNVIDDGGGGAELGDPDHRLERDPDGAAARAAVSATHGATRLLIGEDGSLELTRFAADGSEVDRLSLAPPEAGG